MPIVRKQLIAPGPVFVEDEETGNPVLVDIKQGQIDRWVSTGRQMLRAGLSIPVPYEHQNLKPMTESERRAHQVKNNAGFVKDFVRLSGKTYVDLDIPDAAEAKKLGTTIKYVSPDIEPRVVDGNGRVWEGGVIAHVALTNRPRWMDQDQFSHLKPGEDGADLLGKLSGGKPLVAQQYSLAKPLRLSMATAVVRKGAAWKWADPPALLRSLKLSTEGGPMAAETTITEDEAPAVPETETPLGTGGDAAKPLIAGCSKMLAECGIKVPDGSSSAEQFLEQLHTALIAHEHAKKHYSAESDEVETPSTPEEVETGSVTEEPHSMMMSLTKITDPLAKAMADRQAKVLKASITADIKALVDGAAISPAEAKELEGYAKSLQFSLNTKTGDVECGLSGRILQMVAKGAKRKKPLTGRIEADEQPQPTDADIQLSMGATPGEDGEIDKDMMALADKYVERAPKRR